jgi:hypothetical protein
MQTTIKLPCQCESEFHDATYGKGIRLHTVGMQQNSTKKELEGPVTKATCGVCGIVKTGSSLWKG